MADPALTVADLEVPLSSPSDLQVFSAKETDDTLSHRSILKKSKSQESKKVIFSDPARYPVHEISINNPNEDLKTASSNTESLKTLSMLSSQGLLHSEVQSAQDLRWKTNSISTRHLNTKHYAQSPCEIFRQRLNSYYVRNMQRNMASPVFELKKPEPQLHMVVGEKQVMVVRSFNNSNN